MAKKKQKKGQQGQHFLSPEQYVRQRVRSLEIGKCYVIKDIDKVGLGHVVVTRRHQGGRLSAAFYLVDMACLGVKDSFYRLRMEDFELDDMLQVAPHGFRECSYEEAHNRVYGSIAYAEEAGIEPHKNFQLTQYFFEEDTDEIPLQEFDYGRDGKHHLVCHSRLEASRYLPLLRKHLGEGNFTYLVRVDTPYGDDDILDDDDTALPSRDDGDPADRLKDVKTTLGLPATHFTMDDILQRRTQGLAFFSILMNYDIPDDISLDEARKRYIANVLKDPYELMRRLPVQDTQVIIKMYQQEGDNTSLCIIYPEIISFLQLAGLADGYWFEGDYYIRLADDFREVAFPLADRLLNDKNVLARQVLESTLDGLANIFGVLTLSEAKRFYVEHSKLSAEQVNDMFDLCINDSVLMSFILRPTVPVKDIPEGSLREDQIVIYSRYAWDNNGLLRQKIFDVPGSEEERVSMFNGLEAIMAGSGIVPIMPNKRAKAFAKYLCDTLSLEDAYADEVMFEIWYRLNHAEDPDFHDTDYLQYYKEYVMDYAGISKKVRESHRALEMLEDYVCNLPQWLLRGRTQEDV